MTRLWLAVWLQRLVTTSQESVTPMVMNRLDTSKLDIPRDVSRLDAKKTTKVPVLKKGRKKALGLAMLPIAGLGLLLWAGSLARAQSTGDQSADAASFMTASATTVGADSTFEEPISPPLSGGQNAHGSYRLGPGDEVTIEVIGEEEIPRSPIPVGADGVIHVPLVGAVTVEGLGVGEVGVLLTGRYRTYIHDPQVIVRIVNFNSQPVSVIGAVKQPGLHQLRGRKSLIEVLALAGGLREDAGHVVKITRRREQGPIPLATARDDSTGRFNVASANIEDVLKANNPADNVIIEPNDVISVPRAEMVYVIGAVNRSGGFVLRERESISVLQALSLAGGVHGTAAVKRARILRPAHGGGERAELPINLKRIMASSAEDVALQPEDILFVPNSSGKTAAGRAADAAIRVATGVAIFRR